MLLEIAKPVALVLCLVSLLAVFHAAFLAPTSNLEQQLWDSLARLSLTAGICVSSGLLFRDSSASSPSLLRTLPVQMFCWGIGLMAILFIASWYLDTHCVFYRDVRRF